MVSPEGLGKGDLGVKRFAAAAEAEGCAGSGVESDEVDDLGRLGFEDCGGGLWKMGGCDGCWLG